MFAMSAVREWGHPPPAVTNVGAREGPIYSTLKVSKEHLSHLAVQQEDWSTFGEKTHLGIIGSYSAYLEPDVSDDFDSYTLADVQPHILQAKMSVSDPDNPTYRQAMASPDADKWWDAMVIEMKTLEEDMKCWQLVKQPDSPGINILPSKWAFKLKRYPDGTAKKFKARFCVRGDRQVEGVDFWETWAPVVQWSTVRTMMILSTKLGLKSAQADITAAFVHADLEEGEDIYVQQPKGMERGTGLVLKLKKSVYGLKQAPRYFFTHLSRKMELCGLKQSNKDPCLFIGKTVIAVVYVDDVLFYSKSDDEIDRIITSLRNDHNILIRREGDAEGFLGVSIVKEKSSLVLTQSGLTERIVKALGLCSSYSTAVRTPAELSPLPKDADGEPAVGNFNYAAVVGMLLYLSGHSRPDIAFAVHQCARYTFRPTKRHEQALVRIGRYLKGTMNRGLIMSPTNSPSIDCYPDADFAGLYGHEDSQDPHCARSRTGYIIMAFGCPVLWKSRLQTEIALSTMEAEYVALSTACKDLFPIVDMVKELAGSVGIEIKSVANMHINIHEDNVGALTLAKLEPARMTPRSKHYAIKYHWFREHVHANRVNILKIDSKNQLGDLFTKGLARPAFEHLRCLLMGW
jgi:histone deacetylase 1/2